jgi:hypothetical protein
LSPASGRRQLPTAAGSQPCTVLCVGIDIHSHPPISCTNSTAFQRHPDPPLPITCSVLYVDIDIHHSTLSLVAHITKHEGRCFTLRLLHPLPITCSVLYVDIDMAENLLITHPVLTTPTCSVLYADIDIHHSTGASLSASPSPPPHHLQRALCRH